MLRLSRLPSAARFFIAATALQAEPRTASRCTARRHSRVRALPLRQPGRAQRRPPQIGAHGSFDSLNPLIVRGVPPHGIRDFVIESLMARGLDEPFTLYGLIAETIEMPDDRDSITFHLNPAAQFSDGKPITAADVLFSFNLLKAKGRPNHRTSSPRS